MKTPALLVLALPVGLLTAGALTPTSVAQEAIAAGTILPVQLNSSLHFDKAHVGQTITARIMQDVPLPAGSRIRAGARVIGHVIAFTPATKTSKAEISLRFDTVAIGKQRLPVITNLRALATMMDVAEAQIPESGPDRGTSIDTWTTNQIGGEVVYRGAMVAQGSTVVGHSLRGSAVLARVSAKPGSPCRGGVEGNDRPQALWVFSSNACGIYDYPDLLLTHARRTAPVGQITLQSRRGGLTLRAGSGMLLRVNGMEAVQNN